MCESERPSEPSDSNTYSYAKASAAAMKSLFRYDCAVERNSIRICYLVGSTSVAVLAQQANQTLCLCECAAVPPQCLLDTSEAYNTAGRTLIHDQLAQNSPVQKSVSESVTRMLGLRRCSGHLHLYADEGTGRHTGLGRDGRLCWLQRRQQRQWSGGRLNVGA